MGFRAKFCCNSFSGLFFIKLILIILAIFDAGDARHIVCSVYEFTECHCGELMAYVNVLFIFNKNTIFVLMSFY